MSDRAYPVDLPPATHLLGDIHKSMVGETVTVNGFIQHTQKASASLGFATFLAPSKGTFHLGSYHTMTVVSDLTPTSTFEERTTLRRMLAVPKWSPVSVTATVRTHTKDEKTRIELALKSFKILNTVDPTLMFTRDSNFSTNPAQRHLELRTDTKLRKNLERRAVAGQLVRNELTTAGFLEVETPLLFKSTSEGAREFLVPTRHKDGATYALPQSPQQYKQILMASGISRYFQFARCFRDEDNRIDRQPEFTQLDLEIAFGRAPDVMNLVETTIRKLWQQLGDRKLLDLPPLYPAAFPVMTYFDCMKFYGTDKPDLNYSDITITRRQYHNKSKTTEALVIRNRPEQPPSAAHELLAAFLTQNPDKHLKSYIACEATANGVPLHQLTGADIDELNESLSINPGDIVLLRENKTTYAGGSTIFGQLRLAFIRLAVDRGFLPARNAPRFLWVHEFPLFTPTTEVGPGEGQGGQAGLTSTHHPFTAPLESDLQHIATNPERVRAEHYDLVYNGIELGGGSRRIHDPELQRYILEEVIKVPQDRMVGFEALITVLASGCPPHAGLAIGWDRLMAVLGGSESVRDVIAFPKNGKGRDDMVSSPSIVGRERWAEYGLRSLAVERKERWEKERADARAEKERAEERAEME